MLTKQCKKGVGVLLLTCKVCVNSSVDEVNDDLEANTANHYDAIASQYS